MIDRALCGMGVCFQCVPRRACLESIPDARVDIDHAADVIVIGAGPAGLAAAVHAAKAKRHVTVYDMARRPGGQIWRHRDRRTLPRLAREWLDRFARSGATFISSTEIVDAEALRGRTVVLATGARERYLPFPGWTLPGVVGIGGAQALLKNGGDFTGRRVVIAGSGPLMLTVGAALARAGARLVLVAEQASRGHMAEFAAGLWRSPRRVLDAIGYRTAFLGAPYRVGTWVTRAESPRPGELAIVLSDGRRVVCDILCTGYGLVPSTELARLVGCATSGGAVVADARQETTISGVFCAGEPTGIGGADAALVEGAIAGRPAAGRDPDAALVAARQRHRVFSQAMDRAFAPRPEVRALADASTIVCRCEDVALGALDRSLSPRQAKLYTRIGMGPCQGRVCGPITESLFGWPTDAVRPPLLPTPVRAFL
jgi:NADPH-dependent 2,4-dienoyl-CoA reductase/sulfur reductase-like enzyme